VALEKNNWYFIVVVMINVQIICVMLYEFIPLFI
jgi:hypothetical protein